MLLQQNNLLNKQKIQKYINNINIIILNSVNSTNQYMLDNLSKLKSGDICLAETQSEGRGRRGHKWFSPFGNIYFSIYWKFFLKNTITTIGLSLTIGVVIAEILNKKINKKIKLKWPNDLYINNKKLAGILIESIKKNDNSLHTIIGIGINIEKNKNNIKNKNFTNNNWTYLKEKIKNIERNELIANITQEIIKSIIIFEKNGLKPFINRWIILDKFFNKNINILTNNSINSGIERGINNYGELLLENSYGKINSYINGKIFNTNKLL
ncbi:biotin--[acetyl-CoA-carboxylase] ligase [Candidatus Providencia siddallii]|uniref:Bifunctional ligase/repressor BirA, partial n=1 Tax=Candidatus Providencia siddallii TaxID=1715285 RepID=A0ABM9NNU9_9GAMM